MNYLLLMVRSFVGIIHRRDAHVLWRRILNFANLELHALRNGVIFGIILSR